MIHPYPLFITIPLVANEFVFNGTRTDIIPQVILLPSLTYKKLVADAKLHSSKKDNRVGFSHSVGDKIFSNYHQSSSSMFTTELEAISNTYKIRYDSLTHLTTKTISFSQVHSL